MAIYYATNINKIKQNKEKLEKALKVKLSFSGKNIIIKGLPLEEFVAEKVIDAMELGFMFHQAILIADEEFVLEKIHIKDLTKRHDLSRIRARIIGTKGKTKEIIQNLSDCVICVHENTVGIIGLSENIKKAITALTALIQGKKQGKVYGFLEKERSKEKTQFGEDLGLKIKSNKKP